MRKSKNTLMLGGLVNILASVQSVGDIDFALVLTENTGAKNVTGYQRIITTILRILRQKKGVRNEQNYKNSIHVGSNRNNL